MESSDKKIVKLDQDSKLEVRDFSPTNLQDRPAGVFRTPILGSRPKGTLKAKVDEDAPRKDRRFHVDPAMRDLLAVDEEANHEIEARVELRLRELRSQVEATAEAKGYADGFAKGESEAQESFSSQADVKLAKVDRLIAGFENAKMEVYLANERFLVELVHRITGAIIEKEIELDPEYLGRVVRSVVERVGVKEQLKLVANADQLEVLYSLLPELEKKHPGLKNISIESSSSLNAHDVVIETDFNRIDATLATQLGSLRDVVMAALEASQAARSTATSEAYTE